jgi:hypothetical protein
VKGSVIREEVAHLLKKFYGACNEERKQVEGNSDRNKRETDSRNFYDRLTTMTQNNVT